MGPAREVEGCAAEEGDGILRSDVRGERATKGYVGFGEYSDVRGPVAGEWVGRTAWGEVVAWWEFMGDYAVVWCFIRILSFLSDQ